MKLKIKINDKIANLFKSALNAGKKLSDLAIDYGIALIVVTISAFAVLKAPETYNKYLRSHVGSKVYMIRDSLRSGGGTGFAIKAPSGESYILTNDHVCGVSKDGKTVLVTGADDVSMRRNIVAHDEDSDLCLIEGVPGVEGLAVANFNPSKGDTLNVIGHPRLMPLHLSQGELTGSQTVVISMGPISIIDPDSEEEILIPEERGGVLAENCSMRKNIQRVEELDFGFFQIKVKFCYVKVENAYVTSVIIHPGNSGSPVVNFWGSVEGVAFASDGTNWGRMVNLHDIKHFLQNY